MSDAKILNPQQKEAIFYGGGPLLIIAGAGTGKTTVITERIKYLILERKIPPSHILALTFTEKAAFEMEERVDVAMPYGYTQLWISTFHAFCDRILRNEAIHIGLNPSYKLMTEAETVLFLRNSLFKFNLEYFRPLGNPNKFLQGLIQHFSRLKDEDVSPIEYDQWAKTQNVDDEVKKNRELADAYKTYEGLKTKEGVMDYSDLIAHVLTLFRNRKNILKQYQDQFRYILVDEFQDTNYAQNQLAILLGGEEKNITVVGDDDQSVYRFRGSSVSNIIQFKETFPNTKIVTLTKNYRSTEAILDTSYTLIQNNNPDRLEVKEKVNKKLSSARKIKGEPIEFLFTDRVENEAELVAKKIQEFVAKKQYKYQDIAILVRANDHAHAFSQNFQRNKIPYQFLGPGRLFHQEEIKDLIAYLKVLYNFEDSVSLYRVLTMPIFEFEPIDIAALLNLSRRKNLTLFEALQRTAYPIENTTAQLVLKDSSKEKIKQMVDMILRHLKLVSNTSAGQILYYFLKDSGFLRKVVHGDGFIDERKSQNIARFFEKLKSFEAEKEDARVFPVVEWIDLSMQMGESPLATDVDWSENNAVNILTVHSSKGLEFSVVFLVNLVSQRFPTRERKEQIPIPQELIKEILPEGDYHLEEERRLFYVGMTRAKDRLFLTAAKYYGEGKRERKLSPFVYEALRESEVVKSLERQKAQKTAYQPSLLDLISQNTKEPTQLSTFNSQLSNFVPITYLSYSQIQTFDICPLHYKLKYILKVPDQATASQSFGTSIHATLRDFYQRVLRGENVTVSEIETILRKNWINDGYASKMHEDAAFEKAKMIVLRYIENNFDPKTAASQTLGLEIPFQFVIKNINDDKQFLKIGGRLDRIDKIDENSIEILDYKTGSNMLDEKDLSKNIQLTIYALAATEVKDPLLNKKPHDVLLSLYYLETDKKLTTQRTIEQLQEAKKLLFEKAQEIAISDFKCSGSNICQNCEYKMLCDF